MKFNVKIIITLSVTAVCAVTALVLGIVLGGNGGGQPPELKNFVAENITITRPSTTYNGTAQMFGMSIQGDVTPHITYSKNGITYTNAASLNLVNAGEYTVYYKLSATGYNDYKSSCTFTIEKANIHVTINDGYAVKSTQERSEYSYKYITGDPVEGDDFQITFLDDVDLETAQVGDTYTITAITTNPNYTLTYTAGIGTVIEE